MPSSNGVYSLPPVYHADTGTVIQAIQHNSPLEDIAAALTARLSRDGSAPMTGALQLSPGTVSLPGAVFQTDATTGWFKTTAGIGIAVGGVKVAEFTAGGLASGARILGELVPFTGTTPPPLFVLPFGQTLSRTTYPNLWTFAQAEIAASNTLYNNGDGSTTFGIPDLRGRVPAGWDKMGGTAASRLTLAAPGVNGAVLGTAGGEQAHVQTTSEMPAHAHFMVINDHGHTHGSDAAQNTGGVVGVTGGGSFFVLGINGATINSATSNIGIGSASGVDDNKTTTIGGGGAHNNVQPTLVCNYILFAGA